MCQDYSKSKVGRFLRHGVVNSLSLAESFDYSQCTFTAKCLISIVKFGVVLIITQCNL